MNAYGNVIDAATMAPIAGASVRAYDPVTNLPYGQRVYTEGDGDFHLEVPNASYNLLIYYYGHANGQGSVSQIGQGQTSALSIGAGYQPGDDEMMAVTVVPNTNNSAAAGGSSNTILYVGLAAAAALLIARQQKWV